MQNLSGEALARAFEQMAGRPGRELEIAAKEAGTWYRYICADNTFGGYCDERGLCAMPASTETLGAYFEWLIANGGSASTVNVHKAAITNKHRLRGHSIDWAPLRDLLQGIRRRHGQPRRQARPLRAPLLKAILARFDPTAARDASEGAALALTWGGALRQSEAVALCWQRCGYQGKGYIRTSPAGVEIRIYRSKAEKEKPEDVIMPAADMPLALEWLGHWAKIRGRKSGDLVFQRLSRSGRLLPIEMAPEAIGRMVRRRVHEHLLATGVDPPEALALAEEYSGHSLRSGFATEASDAGISEAKIRLHCRHRSPITTAKYIRVTNSWQSSALKGVLG
jgi:integrase